MKPSAIYTFSVPANSVYQLQVSGEYFKILAADGAVDMRAEWGTLKGLIAGQGLETTPFQRLEITDVSGSSNNIRLFIGDEKFIDGLAGSVTVSQMVVPRSSAFSNLNKTVTNASAQLLAANAARQYLLIQNKDTAGNLYISFGAGAATVANGVRIIPGGSYELPGGVCTTQEVRAIGDIPSNANIVTVEG
ncbi:hypothetical protein LJR129_002489 [Acidovorax sp. LjRoot129]|uniref:hypothetical protein n=1 Tax=Acidovorax sp. LjRoot129 TaxID=3342260 RepID=UPI003ECCB238